MTYGDNERSSFADQLRSTIRFMFQNSRTRGALLSLFLVYIGIGAFVFVFADADAGPLNAFLERYRLLGVRGVIAVLGGIAIMAGIIVFIREASTSRRFIDVDEGITATRRAREESLEFSRRFNLGPSKEVLDEPDMPPGEPKPSHQPTPTALSFQQYFADIRKLLEEKADAADQKASILLDKGTSYAGLGILFFLASIALWQFLAWHSGFQQQHIFGIASTSFLFLFIEFLSAWFLRQYRHFVDTSTYLIKVKSLFDRYMLVHLAGAEAVAAGTDSKAVTRHLLDLLGREISWPDTYLTKKADVSFARDALEAMSLFAKGIKEQAHSVPSEKAPARKRRSSTSEKDG